MTKPAKRKLTDEERLDWARKVTAIIHTSDRAGKKWTVRIIRPEDDHLHYNFFYGDTPNEALDAAMSQEPKR